MFKTLLTLFTMPAVSASTTIASIQNTPTVTPYAYTHSISMKSNLEIEKGWSGGGESKTEKKELGNLKDKFGVSYDRLRNEEFILTAKGSFQTHTKASGTKTQGKLYLSAVTSNSKHIIYAVEQYSEGTIGWGSQKARIEITVEIMANTDVKLTNYVYAGAWGTVSYAHANSLFEELSLFI